MRGYSFSQALAAGLEPRDYKEFIFLGETVAKLDFRIWGKFANVQCYFTELNTGKKFVLYAHKKLTPDINGYFARDLKIDFGAHDIEGNIYHVVAGIGKRGGHSWESAELCDANGQPIEGGEDVVHDPENSEA